jgi:signal transduction histidine kinase
MLLVTLLALALALGISGLVLAGLFRDHVTRQFEGQLRVQLDQLTAALDTDVAGQPVLRTALADPRWQPPYSGLYWQVDEGTQRGVLRSRSLWDVTLTLPDDRLGDGEVHRHRWTGPRGQDLLVLERRVHWAEASAAAASPRWRVIVAQDTQELEQAQQRFGTTLALYLGALGLALLSAAWFQVVLGLAPLQRLQAQLQGLRQGRQARLAGRFPQELRPLVQDFNGVLEQNEQVVARARQLSGNLAHAIKTPLAVLVNAASDPKVGRDALANLVLEQTRGAREQVDWHLGRARMAASGVPGLRSALWPVLDGLVRVMRKLHAERALQIDVRATDPELAFAGEAQDLQEMLGNVLDNACKWARSRIEVEVVPEPETDRLRVVIDDDGPGLDEAQREQVFERGVRLDERTPGSGLGLAIVREVALLYRGTVSLDRSPLGGLRLTLRLPRG